MTAAENPRPTTLRFIAALANYRRGLFLCSAVFSSLLFYAFPLLPGLLLREFFDTLESVGTGAPAQDALGQSQLFAIGLVVVAIARGLIEIVGTLAEAATQLFARTLVRQNLLRCFLEAPGAQAGVHAPGVAIARFRDDVGVVADLLSWAVDPIGQSIALATGVFLLLRIDPDLALTVLGPVILVILASQLAAPKIRSFHDALMQSVGEVTGLIGESCGAVQAIKLAGAEDHIVRRLDELGETRRKQRLRDVIFNRLLMGIADNLGQLGQGALLLFGGHAMMRGHLSLGDFSLFAGYLFGLAHITRMFGDYLNKYRRAGVSLRRLLSVVPEAPGLELVADHPVHLMGPLPEPTAPEVGDHEPLQKLELVNLGYHHPDGTTGIGNINLELVAGSFTVVTGRIGAGKTTLLRACLGLLPARGEILWNGEPVANPGEFFVPPRSAYAPQRPRLFSESLRDNILLGHPPGEDDQRTRTCLQAIRDAALEPDLAQLSSGIDTIVGPRGVKLSGGQRQRVAAARMLGHAPELLVFDDLSAGLDAHTELELWRRLKAQGAATTGTPPTILAVSHRPAVLRQASQVVVLEGGQIVDAGPLDALLDRCALMRELWFRSLNT